MKQFKTKDRIYIEDGEVMLSVTATAKYRKSRYLTELKEYEVYREYENGDCYCRYLYNSWVGGLYVCFPGDNIPCTSNIQTEEEFDECRPINFTSDNITVDEIKLIASLYPDFKYTLLKWKASKSAALAALRVWKEHKEVEFMLAAGLENLAFSKQFWKMKENERRKVINFVRSDKELAKYKLSQLLIMMKYKLSLEQYLEYWRERTFSGAGNIGYDTYKYLKSINELSYKGKRLYSDYKKMLEFSNHNKNEDYWKYPKDLKARHDKLVEELGTLEELENKAAREKKEKLYKPVVASFSYLNGVYAGYSVFIPQDIETIEKQAKALNQCLVTADYIGKVIKGNCLLVFIQKDGTSIATAELLPGNRLGQFYGNELDRNNCKPSEEVKAAFKLWLENKKNLEKERRTA